MDFSWNGIWGHATLLAASISGGKIRVVDRCYPVYLRHQCNWGGGYSGRRSRGCAGESGNCFLLPVEAEGCEQQERMSYTDQKRAYIF
jgi:hypothetical protein